MEKLKADVVGKLKLLVITLEPSLQGAEYQSEPYRYPKSFKLLKKGLKRDADAAHPSRASEKETKKKKTKVIQKIRSSILCKRRNTGKDQLFLCMYTCSCKEALWEAEFFHIIVSKKAT